MKYSLMIGLNYKKTSMELNGCINDIHSVKDLSIKYLGVKPDNIIIMHDNLNEQDLLYPNKDNIRTQLNELVKKCKSGDVCFLHYSGHGVKSMNSIEPEECIYPADAINGNSNNYVCVNEITSILSKLDKNASLFVLSDSCNTKSIVDFAYVVNSSESDNQFVLKRQYNIQKLNDGPNMVCLTATSGSEKAYDVVDKDGKAYGVLTHAFCELVKRYVNESKPPYYLDILNDITAKTKKYNQTPILSFSKQACLTCVLNLMLK